MLPVHIVCISRRTILSSDEESDETAEPSYQPPTLPRSGPYRAPPLVSSSPPAPPPPPTANSPPPPPVGLRDPRLQIAPIGSSVQLSPQASTSTSTPRRPLQPTAQPRDSMMVRLLTLLEDIKDTQRVQFRMLKILVDSLIEPVKRAIAESITETVKETIQYKLKGTADKLSELQQKYDDIIDNIDEQEQYARRNCLIVFGVPEKNDENTTKLVCDIFKTNLKLEVQPLEVPPPKPSPWTKARPPEG